MCFSVRTTSLLRGLDPTATLFVDVEAGDLIDDGPLPRVWFVFERDHRSKPWPDRI
jgi:hypothetical protein